jgi:hypothetical protein
MESPQESLAMRRPVYTEPDCVEGIPEPANGEATQPAASIALYRPDDRVFIQSSNELNQYFICSSLEASILGGIEGLV